MAEDYSKAALGAAIRDRRNALNMSQRELADSAGYRTGGAVSISRIESGQSRPNDKRLISIAVALGVKPRTLVRDAVARDSAGTTPDASMTDAKVIRSRMESLQAELASREKAISSASALLNDAHASSTTNFIQPLYEFSQSITGAPEPPTPKDVDASEDAPERLADAGVDSVRFGVANTLRNAAGAGTAGAVGAGLGGAAAWGTFAAAGAFGTASTGAAISGLSGVAATNASLALLGGGALSAGGAGILGGTLVLGGIVALPAVAAALGGYAFLSRRNKAMLEELANNITKGEQEVAESQKGYDALVTTMKRAAAVFEVIGVHGGRAMAKWLDKVNGTSHWEDLSPEDQAIAKGFVQVAAAHVTVESINYTLFLTLKDSVADQEGSGDHDKRARSIYIEATDHLLSAAQRAVEEVV